MKTFVLTIRLLVKSILLFLIVLLFTSAAMLAQIVVTTTSNAHEKPLLGYNGNTTRDSSWTWQPFRDSVAALNPDIIRYPGGQVSNWWDWKKGWFVDSPAYNGQVLLDKFKNLSYKPVGLDQYKLIVDAVNNETVFCLNMCTDTIENQLAMLRYAQSIGVDIKYVELGNELWNQGIFTPQIFNNAQEYAEECNLWIDSVKTIFPNAKVGLVGGDHSMYASVGTYPWNNSIFNFAENFDAIIEHDYTPLTEERDYPYDEALARTFSASLRHDLMGYNSIPDDVEIWVTEFNIWEKFDPTIQYSFKWAHAIFISAMADFFLEDEQTTMILNHNIQTNSMFGALAGAGATQGGAFHKKPGAIAMDILQKCGNGMDYVQNLDFANNPRFTVTINSNSKTFEYLFGKRFFNEEKEIYWIVNPDDADSHEVDISSLGLSNATYDQYYETALMPIAGYTMPHAQGTITGGSFILRPLSITVITHNVSTGTEDPLLTAANEESFKIFPNPAGDEVCLGSKGDESAKQIDILNVLGATVRSIIADGGSKVTDIDISSLKNGLYFLRITTLSNNIYSYKLMKE